MSEDRLRRAVRAVTDSAAAPEVLERLADVLVPGLGDWCVADLLEPPDLVTRVVARDAAGPLELADDLGPVGARRSSAAARGALSRLVDAPGRLLRLGPSQLQAMTASAEPRTRAQGRLALQLGTAEVLLCGVTRHDALLGVVALGRTQGAFLPEEVASVGDLVAVAALALDGLRLLGVQRSVSTALQRSLLPQLPVVAGLGLTARFVGAGSGLAVGGDWYDAFLLPSGELAVVIGDATGHDVQAATRMAELRSLLRALAVDRRAAPARTLARLDDVLASLAPDLSGTCLYAQLSGGPGGRSLRWSSAGHLPPVLLRDGRASALETAPDLMLGVRAGTARHDARCALHDGDLLVLYTDGLVEDRRTDVDKGLRALRALTEAVGGAAPEVLADRLVGELASGEDDVAVLIVQVEG